MEVDAVAKVVQTLCEVIPGKAPGLLDVLLDLIAASGQVGIQVMTDICQIALV